MSIIEDFKIVKIRYALPRLTLEQLKKEFFQEMKKVFKFILIQKV